MEIKNYEEKELIKSTNAYVLFYRKIWYLINFNYYVYELYTFLIQTNLQIYKLTFYFKIVLYILMLSKLKLIIVTLKLINIFYNHLIYRFFKKYKFEILEL